MPQFDFSVPTNLPADLLEMIGQAPLPGLGSSPRCQATGQRIKRLLDDLPALRGSPTEAAIWLLAGELNTSHEVSQTLETEEGAYWHGIMHRREGDFWNAKYWFRKVGAHPVLERLSSQISFDPQLGGMPAGGINSLPVRDLSNASKIAGCLVDSCERASASQPSWIAPLQRICWFEWQFLFLHGWA